VAVVWYLPKLQASHVPSPLQRERLTTVELGCGLFDIYQGQKNGASATWSHQSTAWLWFDLSLT
jgi:hypothetical protein